MVRRLLQLEKGLWEMAQHRMIELLNTVRAVRRQGIMGIARREEKGIIDSSF